MTEHNPKKIIKANLKMAEYIKSFKIVVVGNSGVGKTSLINRWIKHSFRDDQDFVIRSVSFQIRVLKIGTQEIHLKLWDTAGQERFRLLSPSYYSEADLIILVDDITHTEPESQDNLRIWFENAQLGLQSISVRTPTQSLARGGRGIVVVVTKIDLVPEIVIHKSVLKFCQEQHVDYFCVSSKTGQNADSSLISIVENNLLLCHWSTKNHCLFPRNIRTHITILFYVYAIERGRGNLKLGLWSLPKPVVFIIINYFISFPVIPKQFEPLSLPQTAVRSKKFCLTL